jgi:hypothetical protein
MSGTAGRERCQGVEERVLRDVDLVGIVLSVLLDTCKDDRGLATRAAHSLCLTSTSVRAAVLACVQRVRMDAPLPAVLQRMASLASLHVGAGPLEPLAQLPQLTCLQADEISSPVALSAVMHLTRLQELRLGMDKDAGHIRQALRHLPQQPPQPGHQLQPDAAAAGHHRPADSPQQSQPRWLREPAAAAGHHRPPDSP